MSIKFSESRASLHAGLLTEVDGIIRSQVLKREVVEGDEASAANARVNRFYRKSTVQRRPKKVQAQPPTIALSAPEESVTERLLRESEEMEKSQPGH